MANLSEAHGTFKIKNGNKLDFESIKQLLSIISNAQEETDYATILLVDHENDASIKQFIQSDYEVELYGAGRWHYEHNIKKFIELTFYEDFINDTEPINSQLIKTLIENNIQFTFDYYDYEPGASPDVIFHDFITIKLANDENKYVTKIVEYRSDDIDENGDNLLKYGFIDEYCTFDEMKNADIGIYFMNEDVKEDWLEENEDEFEDGSMVYVPQDDKFVNY
ncbi:hypothetical protein [Staphylococcus gallinarum]|uniref:hypothetical protein n=1 Tax=Staphylococcus gallinarum TaxID=1293 RepID=UPI001E30EDE4|nr:hypothetical protein [Staphylococcus gallinarum]MCD8845210.1 hypothetical protein [Staphylococcus gallinarum]